ncbi:hypothetical protein ACHAW5_003381 [Stephanodiscus triporus]|uniref:Enoyl reductase (ER) domain-containing protein n=1 Tax=Stephanodiscus triporus TaxID=2934178 RepID=A0ABD3NGD6_9STRA
MEVLGATRHGEYDESLEFMRLEIPKISSENDVLIEIAYTDVNPVDLQKLRGSGNGGPVVVDGGGGPFVPGYGGSGTVLEAGALVPADWKGRRACFVADPGRRGSYATHILVDRRCVAPLPSGIDARDSASVPVAGLTAYESLRKAGLALIDNDGGGVESLLVVGGAGGVGSWTIALARAWHPALKIVATSSTEEGRDWCLSLGADEAIPHEEITLRLPSVGADGSVDAIICLAEPTPELFRACADVIRPYGTVCLVVAGKAIRSLDLSYFLFKCATVATQTVFSSMRTNFRRILPSEELGVILKLMDEGRVKAPISPDLVSGKVREDFREALSETGVLCALAKTGGRRGKFVMKIHRNP